MIIKIIKILSLLLFTSLVFADQGETKTGLSEIRSEYKQKNYGKALTIADKYLKKYPNDPDVKLFVGLSLYKLNQNNKAENVFKEILQKHPKYNDVRYGLINTYLKQKKYKDAELQLEELKKYSSNKDNKDNKDNIEKYSNKINSAKNASKNINKKPFEVKKNKSTHINYEDKLYRKAGLYYEQGDFQKSIETLMKIKDYKSNSKYRKLYDELNKITSYRFTPHFSLAIGNYTKHYMERGENWLFDHAILIYSNSHSSYELGINHARRYGDDEVQQFIRLNPIKNDYVSAYVGFRKSPEAILYPNRTYEYGALLNFGDVINGIFEGQFDRIRKTFLRRYVVGFEKYFGNYYFQFKPIYFVPNKGSSSILYISQLIKYYSADDYLGISIGTGKSPDLADLDSIDFYNIYDDYILVYGQKALTDKFLVKIGVGYNKQIFPSILNNMERHFQTGLLSFKYRFV